MRTFAIITVFGIILLAWVLRAAEQQDNPDALLDRIDNLYEQGKYQEAIPLTEQVVAIYEKSLDPEHPAVATILNNLAELYRIQGRQSEVGYVRLASVHKGFVEAKDFENFVGALNR